MANIKILEGISIGLLAGAITGAMVGLLYSPHSGKVNRDILDEKARDAEVRAQRIIDQAKERVEDILKNARASLSI